MDGGPPAGAEPGKAAERGQGPGHPGGPGKKRRKQGGLAVLPGGGFWAPQAIGEGPGLRNGGPTPGGVAAVAGSGVGPQGRSGRGGDGRGAAGGGDAVCVAGGDRGCRDVRGGREGVSGGIGHRAGRAAVPGEFDPPSGAAGMAVAQGTVGARRMGGSGAAGDSGSGRARPGH